MKQTLTTSQAADILLKDKNASWSYAGAHALIEWFEGLEEEGEEMELCPVSIRCDFTEYSSFYECAKDYYSQDQCAEMFANSLFDSEEQRNEAIAENLRDQTCVIEFEGGIIIQAF